MTFVNCRISTRRRPPCMGARPSPPKEPPRRALKRAKDHHSSSATQRERAQGTKRKLRRRHRPATPTTAQARTRTRTRTKTSTLHCSSATQRELAKNEQSSQRLVWGRRPAAPTTAQALRSASARSGTNSKHRSAWSAPTVSGAPARLPLVFFILLLPNLFGGVSLNFFGEKKKRARHTCSG